VFVVLVTV